MEKGHALCYIKYPKYIINGIDFRLLFITFIHVIHSTLYLTPWNWCWILIWLGYICMLMFLRKNTIEQYQHIRVNKIPSLLSWVLTHKDPFNDKQQKFCFSHRVIMVKEIRESFENTAVPGTAGHRPLHQECTRPTWVTSIVKLYIVVLFIPMYKTWRNIIGCSIQRTSPPQTAASTCHPLNNVQCV